LIHFPFRIRYASQLDQCSREPYPHSLRRHVLA
jgi:hypothetical protein